MTNKEAAAKQSSIMGKQSSMVGKQSSRVAKQSSYTIDDYKLNIIRRQSQQYYLQIHNMKKSQKYSRFINSLSQLPDILQKIFDSVGEFIQSLQNILCEKIISKDKRNIYIDDKGKICFNINIKIAKKNKIYKVQLEMYKDSIRVQNLQNKIIQLQKKVQELIKNKNKDNINNINNNNNNITNNNNNNNNINNNNKDNSINNKDKLTNYRDTITRSMASSRIKDGQVIHYQNPVLFEGQKQLKNKIKQSKVLQKQSSTLIANNNSLVNANNSLVNTNNMSLLNLNIETGLFSNIKYELSESKIVVTDSKYRINAQIIVNKNKRNAIIVQIQSLTSQMKYIGQLNDLQIMQFLQPSTKLKNSKQILNQIKKNIRSHIKQSLRLNDKQNKCQILIIGNDDRITAQIQVKPIIKQQKINQNHNLSSINNTTSNNISNNIPSLNNNISSLNNNVSSLNNNVSSSQIIQKLNQNNKQKQKNKDNKDNKNNKDVTKQSTKQKSSTKRAFDSLSQISFRTKHTTKPSKKGQKLNNTSNHMPDLDVSGQLSLNNYTQDLSSISDISKTPKISKGFLLNQQIKNFKISKSIVQLKQQGLNCIILGRKVSKKTKQLQSQIKILKTTNFLIFGIATEQVGLQNTLLSKYFIGMNIQTGAIYQNGIIKDNKLYKKTNKPNKEFYLKLELILKIK